jgi:hypothetical protein
MQGNKKSSRYVKSEMVNREKGVKEGKCSRPSQILCAVVRSPLMGELSVRACVLEWFVSFALQCLVFLRRSIIRRAWVPGKL